MAGNNSYRFHIIRLEHAPACECPTHSAGFGNMSCIVGATRLQYSGRGVTEMRDHKEQVNWCTSWAMDGAA